jgi:hypothetical protein
MRSICAKPPALVRTSSRSYSRYRHHLGLDRIVRRCGAEPAGGVDRNGRLSRTASPVELYPKLAGSGGADEAPEFDLRVDDPLRLTDSAGLSPGIGADAIR